MCIFINVLSKFVVSIISIFLKYFVNYIKADSPPPPLGWHLDN